MEDTHIRTSANYVYGVLTFIYSYDKEKTILLALIRLYQQKQ